MTEITNKIKKMVSSLDNIKERKAYGLFVAEGTKCVLDTLNHFQLKYIFATPDWIKNHRTYVEGLDMTEAKRSDLISMSHLATPPDVLAVYEIPEYELIATEAADNLVIALDCVQDPGNLGTIMRVADWFGIKTIVCSHNSVDVFNPKVVQSTMGAISRVKVVYVNLEDYLRHIPADVPVYGTFLHGNNIYTTSLSSHGVIVMGNEGQGISPQVAKCVTHRITIPSFPPDAATSESLNVGMATAITVSEFRRKELNN